MRALISSNCGLISKASADFPLTFPASAFHKEGVTNSFALNVAISPSMVIRAITGAFPSLTLVAVLFT